MGSRNSLGSPLSQPRVLKQPLSSPWPVRRSTCPAGLAAPSVSLLLAPNKRTPFRNALSGILFSNPSSDCLNRFQMHSSNHAVQAANGHCTLETTSSKFLMFSSVSGHSANPCINKPQNFTEHSLHLSINLSGFVSPPSRQGMHWHRRAIILP